MMNIPWSMWLLMIMICLRILQVVITHFKTIRNYYLLVKHPFAVGDHCEVDGVQMLVTKRNIYITEFLFNNKMVIYPNRLLSTKTISNFYRPDIIEFGIHRLTTTGKISLMLQHIDGYINNQSDIWYPAPPTVQLTDAEDVNWIKMVIRFSHRINFHDMSERWKRRGLLVRKFIKIFREVDIEYRMLPSTWTHNKH